MALRRRCDLLLGERAAASSRHVLSVRRASHSPTSGCDKLLSRAARSLLDILLMLARCSVALATRCPNAAVLCAGSPRSVDEYMPQQLDNVELLVQARLGNLSPKPGADRGQVGCNAKIPGGDCR